MELLDNEIPCLHILNDRFKDLDDDVNDLKELTRIYSLSSMSTMNVGDANAPEISPEELQKLREEEEALIKEEKELLEEERQLQEQLLKVTNLKFSQKSNNSIF